MTPRTTSAGDSRGGPYASFGRNADWAAEGSASESERRLSNAKRGEAIPAALAVREWGPESSDLSDLPPRKFRLGGGDDSDVDD